MDRHLIAAGFGVLLAASGPAIAAGDGGIVACNIAAWSNDTDPNGLNVRSGPGLGAPVIGHIPTPDAARGEEFAAEMSVTGARNGWFRIDEATFGGYISDDDPKVVFKGEGWVSGRLLGLLLNDSKLHDGPSQDAPVITRFLATNSEGEAMGPDSVDVRHLDDCTGDWVKIEGIFNDKPVKGWATWTCSNQVTTCP